MAADDDFWNSLGAQPSAAAPAAKAAPAQSTQQSDDAFWSTLGTGAPSKAGDIDPITGKPYQFASSGGSSPVAQSTGKPILEDKVPGIGTQAVASLSTDPEQKRRIVASQLFPDLSPQEAQSRIFYGTNGRLAAVGKDGQAFYVEAAPYAPDINQPSSLIPSNALARTGSLAGPALPAVGGLVAGAAAAPTSLVAGPLAAGAGAAAGDVLRQELASRFDPQPTMTPYNPLQTATEVGGAAGGQFLGAAGLRTFVPNRLGASPLDVKKVIAGKVLPEAERVNALAGGEGIRLTPGQASGLPSLLGHEDVIASGASGTAGAEGADIAQAFYAQQRQALEAAYQRHLAGVSPVSDTTDAAMQFGQAAEDATTAARQTANAAARPSYDAAQASGQVMSPDLAQLADVPAVATALEKARASYRNLYRSAPPETPDFALWDLTKRELDDMHAGLRRNGERTAAMSVDSLRSDLLTHLDTAYPTYATARETAAPGQRLASRLEESVGKAADTAGNERAKAVVAPVFNTNNPRAIAEARDAFTAAGRTDEWNAGTRAYLQDLWDTAAKSQEGINPAMLRRQVWADPARRAAIEAAMDPAAFQGLDKFMQVTEAVARSRGMNSLTAPRQAGANALQAAAGDTPGVKAVRAIGNLNPIRLIDIPGRVSDAIAGRMTQRNMAGIMTRLFSPDGMKYLRTLGRLSPGSQRAISMTSEFLGQQAGGSIPTPQRNALEMVQ